VSRKILWVAVGGSVALHTWLLWPRLADRSAASTLATEQPQALVTVRPLSTPSTEPVPDPTSGSMPEPRHEQGPDAESATVATPQPAPDPALASLGAAPAPAPESAPASGPAPVHAPLPMQEPVIVGAPAAPDAASAAEPEPSMPPSEAVAQRLEQFEQSLQSLAQEAPVPLSLVELIPEPSSPIAAPAPAPEPAMTPTPEPVAAPAPRPLALPWLTGRTTQAATDAVRPLAVAITAPAPQRPVAPRAQSRTTPVRAEAPTAAVLRPPQPYRPISTSWRPQQRMRGEAAGMPPAPAVAADRGIAPTTKAPTPDEPVARIAWGDPAEATRILDQGRMLLVCVNEDLEVVGALERADGTWRRVASLPSLGAYSNRVRVVDHVGGFADASRLCRKGEHLAVVVPIGVERRMERAMRDAVTRAGMLWSRTAACFGRLVPTPTGIEFSIDRVEARP
jgi:hypothetical protein